ncbi:hypothetical protein TWF694_002660 [Orbilia ellipsospora]|uniref:alpha-L-rhamnosidase n=1 Tax=Orbilia ellipsospora TaxID=2528407 RepID=A0AAV9X2P7_9PEZI
MKGTSTVLAGLALALSFTKNIVPASASPTIMPRTPQPQPATIVSTFAPVVFQRKGTTLFIDFGLDVYGNLQVTLPSTVANNTVFPVRLGEKLTSAGAIDRSPGGSINYVSLSITYKTGTSTYLLNIPPKPAYTNPAAQHAPASVGEITPFRYAEIDNAPTSLTASSVKQTFVHTAFNTESSSFQSSDPTLNAVYARCKHTMRATTAFACYIDGNRERVPYEADAYINFQSHMACDSNPAVGRYTIEFLLAHPTWPTEWSYHMPMLANAEYWLTGSTTVCNNNYDALKAKLLMNKARASDGLINSVGIIDWPAGERDSFGLTPNGTTDPSNQIGPAVNAVVNAFYYNALNKMAEIAAATNRPADVTLFQTTAQQVYASYNAVFFNNVTGIYTDGEGSTHSSLHANMFPLAFDLVPPQYQSQVADFVQSRGMACSVYGAQYLLEGLFKAGRAAYAISLMTNTTTKRSWTNFLANNSTMTWEAWDIQYKPNLTWNHAWGAAPANIIARYVMGVRPVTPGFTKILVAPQLGGLTSVLGAVSTVRGNVTVSYGNGKLNVTVPPGTQSLNVTVPSSATGTVSLPVTAKLKARSVPVLWNGQQAMGRVDDQVVIVDNVGPGEHLIEFSDYTRNNMTSRF